MVSSAPASQRKKLDSLNWPTLYAQLDREGFALTDPILSPGECAELIALYGEEERFRKRIAMERFRYGVGEYSYFSYPLPPLIQTLREGLYARLVPVANEWSRLLSRGKPSSAAYPSDLSAFLQTCHARGQQRPTPLLLQYGASGYNCLHQDLYGAVAFPLQATFFLSAPRKAYRGGEFLLVENRPRQQSRGTALLPDQGSCVLFPSAERPVAGSRGVFRAKMRHGVSTVTEGRRYTLGIIFHDAE